MPDDDDPDEAFVIATVLGARAFGTELDAPGHDVVQVAPHVVVTVDAMVEGIHFDDRLAAEDVGYKLVAVNASDVGASGCSPTWCLLALSLPAPLDRDWVVRFARGLHDGLATFGARLVGGDVTGSPGPRVASLTMGGSGAHPVGRGHAQVGDLVLVTGTLGRAAAGFGGNPRGLDWLRRPRPPVHLGRALADAALVSAMMDLSDGLATDLPRLCARSGVGATVDARALPLDAATGGDLAMGVAFGDDYELLFTTAPHNLDAVRAMAASVGVDVTPIGVLVPSSQSVTLSSGPWPRAAFSHFAAKGAT